MLSRSSVRGSSRRRSSPSPRLFIYSPGGRGELPLLLDINMLSRSSVRGSSRKRYSPSPRLFIYSLGGRGELITTP